mmetsp:Transcript_491/g.1490  ORF Transcript_491/g.1490 Transcript_491/m.1490 type:complete len:368 (+) Transcript_491:139-1242(+)
MDAASGLHGWYGRIGWGRCCTPPPVRRPPQRGQSTPMPPWEGASCLDQGFEDGHADSLERVAALAEDADLLGDAGVERRLGDAKDHAVLDADDGPPPVRADAPRLCELRGRVAAAHGGHVHHGRGVVQLLGRGRRRVTRPRRWFVPRCAQDHLERADHVPEAPGQGRGDGPAVAALDELHAARADEEERDPRVLHEAALAQHREKPEARERADGLAKAVGRPGDALHHALLHGHVGEERGEGGHREAVPDGDEHQGADEQGQSLRHRQHRHPERGAQHADVQGVAVLREADDRAEQHALDEDAEAAHERERDANLLRAPAKGVLAEEGEGGLVDGEGEAEGEVEEEERVHPLLQEPDVEAPRLAQPS